MDPNETLSKLRALLGGDYTRDTTGVTFDDLLGFVCEAEELFQALDEWLSKGGFLPTDWAPSAQGDTWFPINPRLPLKDL